MTLIETHFPRTSDSELRPIVAGAVRRQPENTLIPRALVTLLHNSDRRSVEAALQRNGYLVRSTNDHTAAEVMLRSFIPDVMVVDAREAYPLPNSLMAQVRRCPEIYIIAVGADNEDQRITILRNGADDALPTAVTPDEIAVRCQVLLRRSRQFATAATTEGQPKNLYFGPLDIDLGRREIRVNRYAVAATRLEFDLFAQLCLRPVEVCSRAELLESVWGPHWVGDAHVVDVHLSNLRRKLTERAPELRFIHTVRGIGFRLADDLLQLAVHDLASSRILESQIA